MKKQIAILTFYFAHNYGAMLQAYALKRYLELFGNTVNIIPYFPSYLKQGYSINPFLKGISIKRRIYNMISYLKRYKQAEKFEEFKKNLISKKEFSEKDNLIKFLKPYDVLICGSDQIWNEKIASESEIYFGAGMDITKISYAASLGTDELSEIQRKNVKKYLSEFLSVSVREETGRKLIKEYIPDVQVVCDPVFLLSPNDWEEIECRMTIQKKYVLLYLLEDNKLLYEYGKKYSQENNLEIYEIHPTRGIHHCEIKQLNNIGPTEFLYLVRNAEAICTNSFHAVAFSIIFEKKLIHIPNSNSPERSLFLLEKVGNKVIKDDLNKFPIYEFKEKNVMFNKFVEDSKQFIKDFIFEISN